MCIKIGIDYHEVSGIHQGSKTYIENLVKEIGKLDNRNTYLLFNADFKEDGYYKGHKNIIQKKLLSNSGRFNLLAGFPYKALKEMIDIFHFQYIIPFAIPCKTVVTIHDILFERYPKFFPVVHRTLLKILIPMSARRATKIITVSEFTKNEIIKFYNIPHSNIKVIYEGVSEEFKKIEDKKLVLEKIKCYNIEVPYILYVGRIAPIKNISGLLKAFKYVKTKIKKKLKLVIVGEKDNIFRETEMFNLIKELNIEDEIIFTGRVASEDLPYLYNGAEVFVSASFGEGFGLPLLEAMACGTPVIASNNTSIPEIVGDAGLLFDPYSLDSLQRHIERVVMNKTLKLELSEKGIKRAKLFSWRKMAEETLELYKSI